MKKSGGHDAVQHAYSNECRGCHGPLEGERQALLMDKINENVKALRHCAQMTAKALRREHGVRSRQVRDDQDEERHHNLARQRLWHPHVPVHVLRVHVAAKDEHEVKERGRATMDPCMGSAPAPKLPSSTRGSFPRLAMRMSSHDSRHPMECPA